MNVPNIAIAGGMLIALWASANMALAEDPRGKIAFKPDPSRGHQTAMKLCTGCHVIDRQQTGTVQPGVPSFVYMANKQRQSPEKLAAALIHPFPPMIETHLSNS